MTGRQSAMRLLALAAMLPLSCAPSDTVTIQGAGATFSAPLYKRWFLEYYLAHPNVRVNYQAIGSGAGVSQLQERLKRVADHTAFLYVDRSQGGRTGYLVECGPTKELFENPREKHTQDYIAGAFS
jgi:hypothetical protein